MSHRRPALVALGLSLSLAGLAVAQQQPATRPARPAVEPADQPAPKMKGDKLEPYFEQHHNDFLKRAKAGPIGVLFLGDSITDNWPGRAKDVFDQHYGKYDPANFGISGDKTQHVLWRLDHGEVDGTHPKVVVLMIGTNNINQPADEIAKGDERIVAELHEKLPETKVLVLGIFPRGADPENPAVARDRAKIKAVNARLAKLDDGNKTRYLDFGDKFLGEDGLLRYSVMPDALHPSHKGYEIWADAMQPTLDEMMK